MWAFVEKGKHSLMLDLKRIIFIMIQAYRKKTDESLYIIIENEKPK